MKHDESMSYLMRWHGPGVAVGVAAATFFCLFAACLCIAYGLLRR